jgi:glycosyltransferase involved in cell wall biosynthesis
VHVAFLTDVALPYVSGVTIAVRRQRDALRAAGTAVTVVGPRGDVDLAEPDVHLPGSPPGYRVALFRPRLAPRLRARGVDVLHAHSVFGASWAGLVAARSLRAPFVVTVHTRFDEYVHYARAAAPLAKTLLEPYTGAVVAAADLVVAPCEELAAELRAAGDARAVRVVAAPVDIALACGSAARGRTRIGVPEGVPVLLSISRLAVEKRVVDLIAALRALDHNDAILAYAGAGPLDAELRAASTRAGVADRVRLLGQLDPPALADALAAASVVVSASRSETQGLALCEAAAAGRAIVAPARGGYAEVLGDGQGGLFPGAAPAAEALADAIDRALGDQLLRSGLAAEAQRRAITAWSPDAVAIALRAAYDAADAVTE